MVPFVSLLLSIFFFQLVLMSFLVFKQDCCGCMLLWKIQEFCKRWFL